MLNNSCISLDKNQQLNQNLREWTPKAREISPKNTFALKQAKAVLKEVMRFRRMVNSEESCESIACPSCHTPHLQKAVSSVIAQEPITFALPAFPGKSPNQAKVLGHLPDMAEQKALLFLNDLCRRIQKIYPPGAHIVICSDGRVFSDVVGITEEHVTAYQNELNKMIDDLGLKNISTFNLDQISSGYNFKKIRYDLMKYYGYSLESLKGKVRRGGNGSIDPVDQEAHRMYCGITRFLFEDSLSPDQKESRTALQKKSRAKAYEVIRRSNAWTELIAERFPKAVRLSIHPQACGSKKLGIQLLGTDSWLTPWHGVAVDTGSEFILMKRWEAEKLNSILVRGADNRASHFRLIQETI